MSHRLVLLVFKEKGNIYITNVYNFLSLTLANYIHWRFVKDLGGYTNQQMRDLAFAFSSAYYGTTQPEAR